MMHTLGWLQQSAVSARLPVKGEGDGADDKGGNEQDEAADDRRRLELLRVRQVIKGGLEELVRLIVSGEALLLGLAAAELHRRAGAHRRHRGNREARLNEQRERRRQSREH